MDKICLSYLLQRLYTLVNEKIVAKQLWQFIQHTNNVLSKYANFLKKFTVDEFNIFRRINACEFVEIPTCKEKIDMNEFFRPKEFV